MKVEVRLFARYREAVGRDRVEIDLPEGGTVETAWEAVSRRFPALGQYRPFTLFALRENYVSADHRLGDDRAPRPGTCRRRFRLRSRTVRSELLP